MKKLIAFVICMSLVLCLFAGVSAFADGGKLTVYGAYQEDELQYLFDEFKKATGIDVYYVRLSAGEIYTRVQAEAENPQASLWIGTSIDTLTVAGQEGYLEKFVPSNIENIPENLRDKNEYWVGEALSVTCFASNTDWLEETGLNAPKSWEELTDEKYAENVVTAHPGTSGAAYAWLSSLASLMGEDGAYEYLKRLDKNIVQYTKGGAAPARMAGLGESGVGVCWSSDAMNTIDSGYHLTLTYPEEGCPYEMQGMAIIKNGPDGELENAQKFIEWSIEVDTQQNYANEYYRLPVVEGTSLPEGMIAIENLNVIEVDRDFASSQRSNLIARFESDVRGSDDLIQ